MIKYVNLYAVYINKLQSVYVVDQQANKPDFKIEGKNSSETCKFNAHICPKRVPVATKNRIMNNFYLERSYRWQLTN